MHFGKITLLVLGVAALIFAVVIALWSMTLPYEQAIRLGVIGTWVAGLSTFGAAVIALWLARRTEEIRMKCIVSFSRMMHEGGKWGKYCVRFKVTNLGILPIIVDTIEWSIGTGRNKEYAIQNIPESLLSASLPKRLEHGKNANFLVCLEEKDMKIWMRGFVEKSGLPGSSIKTLRARIHTTTGHVEVVKPAKDFMKKLAEAINSDPVASTK